MIQSGTINKSLQINGNTYIKQTGARSGKNAFLLSLLMASALLNFLTTNTVVSLIIQFPLAFGLFAANYRLFGKFEKAVMLCGIVFIMVEMALYKDFGSSLTYLNSLVLIMCFNNIALKRRHVSKIFMASSLLMLFFIATASRDGVYYVFILGRKFNPNMVGILLFAALVLGVSGINNLFATKNTKRILSIVLFCIVVFLQIQTAARTTLAAEIMYVLIVLVRNKFKIFKHEKHFKALIVFGFLVCLLIPVVYVALYNHMEGQSITILGKNLFTGRQDVWQDAFRMIGENPVFGVGNEEKFVGVYESAHNSMLAIWKTSGVILLILYVIAFVIAKPKIAKQVDIDLFMRCAIIPVIFIAAFETILTDSNLYVFALLPILNKVFAERRKAYDK